MPGDIPRCLGISPSAQGYPQVPDDTPKCLGMSPRTWGCPQQQPCRFRFVDNGDDNYYSSSSVRLGGRAQRIRQATSNPIDLGLLTTRVLTTIRHPLQDWKTETGGYGQLIWVCGWGYPKGSGDIPRRLGTSPGTLDIAIHLRICPGTWGYPHAPGDLRRHLRKSTGTCGYAQAQGNIPRQLGRSPGT